MSAGVLALAARIAGPANTRGRWRWAVATLNVEEANRHDDHQANWGKEAELAETISSLVSAVGDAPWPFEPYHGTCALCDNPLPTDDPRPWPDLVRAWDWHHVHCPWVACARWHVRWTSE